MSSFRDKVLDTPIGRRAYGAAHGLRFDANYRRRRERYATADAAGTDPAMHVARTRARMRARGVTPTARRVGEIRTFAFVPSNWPHQGQIARAAEHLGPVVRFDYTRHGIHLADVRTAGRDHVAKRREVEALTWDALLAARREGTVDLFFAYGLPWDLSPAFLRRIQTELRLPTVNVSLDDKNWWDEIERGDATSALRPFVTAFDLGWTSARVVLPWYWAEGGQAIYLPEGANTDWFRPLDVPQDIPIGFVGSRMGHRPELVNALRAAGIPIEVRGFGWSEGELDDEAMRTFFSRCRINVGFGDMFYSRWLTNLKGRDFEVPATGRGIYLTTYNADLAECFHLGREILCYRGIDELVEIARRLLRHPNEHEGMPRAARERVVREHQWAHRFEAVARAIGLL